MQSKKKYEVLISDASLDIHKRKYEMMSMLQSVMSSKVPLSLVTQPEIKFLMPPKAISTFLGSLSVDNRDRPTPPILILEQVTFDTMTVSWQTEFDLNVNSISNRRATEFQLCFAKFTKEFILSKKDRKKAKKKDQKQRKKKKRKRRKKYESSSEDSDTDSDSGSSSSSSDDSSESDSDISESSSSSGIDMDELKMMGDDEKQSVLMNEGLGDDADDEDVQFKNIDLSVLNWKSIKKSGKSTSHRVRGLVHGWSYLVRIRGKNDSGWGVFSEPIKVSTKTIELVWNQRKCGKGVTFIDKNRCKFSKKQAKICVDYKIKSKMHKIFCWEFKLHKISNYSWIGFVRGPIKQFVSNWSYFLGGNNANEYSIGFGSGSRTLSIQNAAGGNNGQSIPLSRSIRSGDRFKFKANMKNKTVTVYHNRKNIGVLFQNIPNCIVPAASNSSSSMEISCSFAS